jgi:hypothetical protein
MRKYPAIASSAHHEAGHIAVACALTSITNEGAYLAVRDSECLLGISATRAKQPAQTNLETGRVELFAPDVARRDPEVQNGLILAYAGYQAELIVDPTADRAFALGDDEIAHEVLLAMHGTSEVARARRAEWEQRARQFVQGDWAFVQGLAKLFLDQKPPYPRKKNVSGHRVWIHRVWTKQIVDTARHFGHEPHVLQGPDTLYGTLIDGLRGNMTYEGNPDFEKHLAERRMYVFGSGV